jgi:hypothetical protein
MVITSPSIKNPASPEENQASSEKNPAPPRNLQVLLYVVKPGKKMDFIKYYRNTIAQYLVNEKVEEAVVWTFELDNRTLFAIATSPTIPPWFGVKELPQLTEFVEEFPKLNPELRSIFVNRSDLHIHDKKLEPEAEQV